MEANEHQSKDPMHGVTLEMIMRSLHDRYGWEELGRRIISVASTVILP